ncbi:tetratricopeptide repeat protein [Polycladidibacter stylochi]|uniref:tetratricopeptide repeat protein n=1 Tax=Polycladidibacter stylochi TaxID=1807766 RepID=UPI00082D6A57|nr:SEL1-like repeat protein [Pseudovibrio stylochi]
MAGRFLDKLFILCFCLSCSVSTLAIAATSGGVEDLQGNSGDFSARQWIDARKKGVGKISGQSFDALKAEAQAGITEAQFKLAMAYEDNSASYYDLSKAFENYKKAADAGHPYAMGSLAWYYEYGIVVEKDELRAERLYQDAMEFGDTWSARQVGRMYLQGRGVPKNIDYGLSQIKWAQEQGDSWATLQLADLYINGLEVKRDLKLGQKYAQDALQGGVYQAYAYLGLSEENGVQGQVNFEKAVEYYEQGFVKGDALSSFYLSTMLLGGYGVEKDAKRAFELVDEAQQQGLIEAKYRYAYMLENGLGCDANYMLAVQVYTKLVEDYRHSMAMARLGSMKLLGHDTRKDEAAGIELLKKGYENGYDYSAVKLARHYMGNEQSGKALTTLVPLLEKDDEDALYLLADSYWFGQGLHQSDVIARQYFKDLSAKGHLDAKEKYAIALLYGYGGEQDVEQGIALLHDVKAEIPDAYTQLGVAALEGLGDEYRISDALKYFNTAAAQGETWAHYELGKLYLYGERVPKDYWQAREHFAFAGDAGQGAAIAFVGYMVENGYGEDMNPLKSIGYYETAAEQGNTFAMMKLVDYGLGPKAMLRQKESIDWLIKAVESGDATAPQRLLDALEEQEELFDEGQWHRAYKALEHNGQLEGTSKFNFNSATLSLLEGDSSALAAEVEVNLAKIIGRLTWFGTSSHFPKHTDELVYTFLPVSLLSNPSGEKSRFYKLKDLADNNRRIEIRRAASWYVSQDLLKAAEKGKHLEGTSEIDPYKYIDKAAIGGLAKAQYAYSERLLFGDGVAQNFTRAARWLRACRHEYPQAAIWLALLLDGGYVVAEKNEDVNAMVIEAYLQSPSLFEQSYERFQAELPEPEAKDGFSPWVGKEILGRLKPFLPAERD